jgi:uncharacterized protein with GYD domain
MTTYIALFNLTDAGIKAAKDSPRRLDAAKKLLAEMGGEMKQFYMVMGEFDFVGICEAPDDAVMARYVLQLGGLGFVRTKTLNSGYSHGGAKGQSALGSARLQPSGVEAAREWGRKPRDRRPAQVKGRSLGGTCF